MHEYETKAVNEVNQRGTTVQQILKAHLLHILHHLIFAGNGVICALPLLPLPKQLWHIRTINIQTTFLKLITLVVKWLGDFSSSPNYLKRLYGILREIVKVACPVTSFGNAISYYRGAGCFVDRSCSWGWTDHIFRRERFS